MPLTASAPFQATGIDGEDVSPGRDATVAADGSIATVRELTLACPEAPALA